MAEVTNELVASSGDVLHEAKLQGPDEEIKVRVLLPEDSRRTISDLATLRVQTPAGGRVPLQEVAHMKTSRGFATLARVDGKRAFTVQAEVDIQVNGDVSIVPVSAAAGRSQGG